MNQDEQQVFMFLAFLGICTLGIPSCGYFAFQGLVKGITLTPIGVRSGWLARLSGLGYLSYVILLTGVSPISFIGPSEIGWARFVVSVTSRFPVSVEMALIFLIFGTVLFLFSFWQLKRNGEKLTLAQTTFARNYSNSMCVVLIVLGLCWLITPPLWLVITLYWVFILYMLTWPKQIMATFQRS
jgi:hypothetical protein